MRTAHQILSFAIAASFLVAGGGQLQCAEDADANPRTRIGLQALYDFASTDGPVVKDRAGAGEPVHLRVTDMKAVRRSQGSLEVRGKTRIRSEKPPTRLMESIRRSGEITIEAWVRPANAQQDGPARIVTLSKNPVQRNFTLGQDSDRYDVRLRTTKTSGNGLPSLSSRHKSLKTDLTHVVYTRDRRGRAFLYVGGKQVAENSVAGDFSNWDGSFQLALANELTGDRPWRGAYHLVAIYSRVLPPHEVEQNFKAGPDARLSPELLAARRRAAQARTFETQIAPLLARHCLECHDAATKKGELDLSQRESTFAGGENGRAIVPGAPSESLLWTYVQSGEMPKDRAPLSPQNKELLRQWIDDGAVWSLERIDPAVYVHDAGAAKNWVRRLTVPEYIETVRSAVGVDIAEQAHKILPPDIRADGFANTAYNLNVDLKHVEAYAKLAERIVERMDVEAFARRFSKSRKLTDKDNRALIAKMGKRLLRGPLSDEEIVAYRGISTRVAAAGGDFNEATRYVIEAMLQSPRFIYRIERQRGDGTLWPVGPYELASRLSYIIWGGPPDEALLKAAETGELSDESRCAEQVRRMLQDPRAVEHSCRFIEQWLHLDRLDSLRPEPEKFPDWHPQLAPDMRAETLAFFREIAWKQDRPLAALFNAQITFATPRLAEHYGLEPHGEGISRYDLSSIPSRGGLLTQGSVLTVGGDDASMVSRGLFVFHELLRGTVNDPPPCVDTTPVPTKSGLTQRGIAEARIANAKCGVCHGKFEPAAFGLEKFDGLGAYFEKDLHGNKLREDGEILFPGRAKPIAYESSAELMDLLAKSERVRETITWKMTQWALGRPLVAADVPLVEQIHRSAQDAGGTYRSVITAMVMSDLVRKSRTERAE